MLIPIVASEHAQFANTRGGALPGLLFACFKGSYSIDPDREYLMAVV